jgi:hypothetical protein
VKPIRAQPPQRRCPHPGHSGQRAQRSQPAHRQEGCAHGGSRQRQGIPALSCQVRRGLRDRAARERIDPTGMDGEDADTR